VFLAGLGIGYLTYRYGALPWIGLTLALTFAFYGLIKKRAALSSSQGIAVETGILFIPAVTYLLGVNCLFGGHNGGLSLLIKSMLVFAGIATGLPLLLFSAAAKEINLSTLGFLQYIAPTLQFLIGVIVYDEGFSRGDLIGFGLIWMALILFSVEALITRRRILTISPAD
jgi:chloramphenicol-sensitive protein RarD